MIMNVLTGFAAAAMLILGGYLFGVKQGYQTREKLRKKLSEQEDLKIDTLLRQSEALHRVIEPLAKWDEQVDKLRNEIKQMQSTILHHDQVALELTGLQTGSGNRDDLAILMNEIAEKAHFEAVLLSDENGLPLVASSNAKNLDRIAAIASFVVIFGDRISRDDPAVFPVSFLVRDTTNRDILCRILQAGKQRLVLTAVSSQLQLTPTALDPTLGKVIDLLSPKTERNTNDTDQ